LHLRLHCMHASMRVHARRATNSFSSAAWPCYAYVAAGVPLHACMHACHVAKARAHACILSPRLYAGLYVCSTSRETRRPYYYPATPKHAHYSTTLSSISLSLSLSKATFCAPHPPHSHSLSGVHKCVPLSFELNRSKVNVRRGRQGPFHGPINKNLVVYNTTQKKKHSVCLTMHFDVIDHASLIYHLILSKYFEHVEVRSNFTLFFCYTSSGFLDFSRMIYLF
jgi:hypothetical protein